MLDVKLDGTEQLGRKLRKMARQIKALDLKIADTVRDWETEIVDRDAPGAWATKGTRVTSVIFRQHSRAQLRRSRMARRRRHYQGRTSTRDVLRKELLDKLIERLDAMLLEIKW